VRDALGEADAEVFCRAYGVTETGNFEHATSVLSRVGAPGGPEEERQLAGLRARLFEARRRRVPPDTDTKVLAAWNGLAVTGLLRAAGATGSAAARAMAMRVAEFLARNMLREGEEDRAQIWRVFKDGQARLDGTLDDYAAVARAFFDVAEATGDELWWRRGAHLVAEILARFHEVRDGVAVFYLPASDSEDGLVHRPESHQDGATPSGAALAVECLLRLGLVAGDERAFGIAEAYLAARAPQAAAQPYMASRLLAGLDLYLHATELVVSEGPGREELLAAARRAYAPSLMIAGPWASESIRAGKQAAADGRSQAYVCRGQACSPPAGAAAELVELLAEEGRR